MSQPLNYSGNVADARARSDNTFIGKRCAADGTSEKYTDTGKCVECESYLKAIRAGRIDGEDNRTPEQKQSGFQKPRRKAGWNDPEGWTDEMRLAHAAAIKRGRARGSLARKKKEPGHD